MCQTQVLNAQCEQDSDEGEDNDCQDGVFHDGVLLLVCSVDDVEIVCVQCNVQPRVNAKLLHSVL